MKQVCCCLQMPGMEGGGVGWGGGRGDTINCQMPSPSGLIMHQMPGICSGWGEGGNARGCH